MRILPQSLHCNTRTFTTVCNPIWSSDPLWGCVGISFPLPGEHFNRLTSIYASNNVSHGQYCCSRIHTSEPLTYFFLLAPDSFLGSGVALKCPEHCIAKSNHYSHLFLPNYHEDKRFTVTSSPFGPKFVSHGQTTM